MLPIEQTNNRILVLQVQRHTFVPLHPVCQKTSPLARFFDRLRGSPDGEPLLLCITF